MSLTLNFAQNIAFRLKHTKFSVLKLIPCLCAHTTLNFKIQNLNSKFKIIIHNSKSKFEISNQNQKFKINEHALTNFELQFVISDVMPHFFPCTWWKSTVLNLKGFVNIFFYEDTIFVHMDMSGKYTVAATYLAASPYSRSSSSPTTTATARRPRIVSLPIYLAVNVLDLLTQF